VLSGNACWCSGEGTRLPPICGLGSLLVLDLATKVFLISFRNKNKHLQVPV